MPAGPSALLGFRERLSEEETEYVCVREEVQQTTLIDLLHPSYHPIPVMGLYPLGQWCTEFYICLHESDQIWPEL